MSTFKISAVTVAIFGAVVLASSAQAAPVGPAAGLSQGGAPALQVRMTKHERMMMMKRQRMMMMKKRHMMHRGM